MVSKGSLGCVGSCGTGTLAMVDGDVKERIKAVPGWTLEDGSITRTFKFKNRASAALLLAQLFSLSEYYDHDANVHGCHLAWTLTLTTHSAGNKLTAKDFKIAEQIDFFAASLGLC